MRAFEPGIRSDDLRRLLENGTWVRRLATRLLWDESLADDIVQEVWITALQRPPSKPGALRAWLKAVVRSLCLRANRAFARRKRLESGGAPDAHAPSPHEVEERIESQRRLLAAVLSLGEPYRSVVYLHFYESLKLVEVARLQGISDSTVRTQLSRGLEQLRERLASEYGGDGAMRTMLLALVLPAGLHLLEGAAAAASLPAGSSPRPAGPRASGPAPTGSPLAARARFLAQASAALVLLAAPIVILWSASRSDDPAARKAALTPGLPVEAARLRTAPDGAARRDLEPGRAAAVARPAGSRPVRVVVVDSSGAGPVGGARVYRAPRTEPESLLLGVTGADGTLLVADPAALRDPWILLAEGFVELREPAARRDALDGDHVVELEAEFPAVVAVLDPAGAPLPGVAVSVRQRVRGLAPLEPLELVTDPRGEAAYTFRHPDTSIRIAAPGTVSVSLPAETPRMTVRLRSGVPMDGLVVGPGGAPLADCRVRLESPSLRDAVAVVSGAEGTFALGVLDPAEEVTLRFRAPGLPPWRFTGRPPPAGPWRFEIPPGIALAGVVAGAGGEPIAGGHVFILAPEGAADEGPEGPIPQVRAAGLPPARRATRRLVTRARASIDDAGRFALDPVAAGAAEEYLFALHPTGGRRLERLEIPAADAPLDIRLERGVKLTGALTSPGGKPLAGVLLHFGEVWSNGIECVIGRTRTAGGGVFVLDGLPDGVGQTLPGAWDEDGNAVVRLALFVAAFAPDEIVEAGGSGGVAEELFPGAFDISDIASRGGALRLVGAARERLASLAVRLRDEDGLPIRAWTRAAVLDPAGGVHTGIIGRNLEGARFFSDDTLDVERLRGSDLVLMPAGHRWTASSGLDLREGGAVDVMLAPISPSPWHLRLRLPDGAPAAGRPVFAGLPFGAAVPRAAVSVGTTDEDGALTTGFLPPGLHAIGAPFEGSEMAGVKAGALLGPEAFAGRIAWTRCEVRDGGQLDLTVPAR